jgi:hypothetical protein
MSTLAEILVVIKYDAFQYSNYDNTFCDVTTPLWYVESFIPTMNHRSSYSDFARVFVSRPRLLGYAAMPLLQAIPCALLALYAGLRMSRMHKIHKRLLAQIADNDDYYDNFNRPSIRISRPSHRGHQSNHDRSSSAITSISQPEAPPGLGPDSFPLTALRSSAGSQLHDAERNSPRSSFDISSTSTAATHFAALQKVGPENANVSKKPTLLCIARIKTLYH